MIAQGHILHVADEDAWGRMRSSASYAPAAYEDQGFIHCCGPEQLNDVLERHFQDTTEVTVLKGDVSDESQVNKLKDEIASKAGKVQILINNAGINIRKRTKIYQCDEYGYHIYVNH